MITLVTDCGLGNRIRAISSARKLADATGHDLTVIWGTNSLVACTFHELFEPSGNMRMVEVAPFGRRCFWRLDLLLYRAKRKTLPVFRKIVRFAQRLRFGTVISKRAVKRIMVEGWNLDRIANARNALIISDSQFFGGPIHRDMFVPVAQLRDRIDAVAGTFADDTVGVHIRRTDKKAAIANSPDELFEFRMNSILEERPGAMFFLATDCADTEAQMHRAFPGRILTAEPERDRSTGAGTRASLIDMFCLARTSYILGSYSSSFGEMASALGDVEMEVIDKHNVES